MNSRAFHIQIVFILLAIVFVLRLFYIQILDNTYKQAAKNNVVRRVIQYPYRGLVYDRNNKLVVYNNPVYDLMAVFNEISLKDTAAFCNLLKISKHYFKEILIDARKDRSFSPLKPYPLIKQLSNSDFAAIQDSLINFPGFFVQARTVRSYPHESLANALGYIGEIDANRLSKDTLKYYKKGDFIGISGLESFYEPQLRGKRGVKHLLVDVNGIIKGSFKSGAYDTLSKSGETLVSSIDLTLQKYGEKLMKDKVGSIVAIEPSSGEILALVSAPSYDPNLLTGRYLGENYLKLRKDSLSPLFNRPIMALYPPGSIFKILQSLVALQEGVIKPETTFACNKSLVNCHSHPSPANLHRAIQYSCNPYFYNTFKRIVNQDVADNPYLDSKIGLDKWKKYIERFGLGNHLGIDLPNEKRGSVPSSTYYDKVYGENNWRFSTIYSLSIGQGEMLLTPLQMANLAAIIANKGYYYPPHLIKEIDTLGKPLSQYQMKHHTGIEKTYYEVVIDAMEDAVYGTAGRAVMEDIIICGKTGTVQNKGRDHSVFMAFAPKENPKIAIAVYVENAGWGGRAAASTASLMIEKYIKKEISRPQLEEFVLKGAF